MMESLNVDPEWWHQMGRHHHTVASGIREWAAPPADFLRNFEAMYGKAAYSMALRVHQYYVGVRQPALCDLADRHATAGGNCFDVGVTFVGDDQGGMPGAVVES
ncbi:hypothetical protein [Nocardia stercoris]|uniref:Uncharacterized protein n=1 Tax=Nocardia stercoris TaxID=2483361 RepID=A0A3M2L422_9NOCA|nr:hypothetical protein [Nocardia stercoris]RMI31460.1 hypothetical protein EBN03_19165 [Nocardia stercoris]